jgi:glycosyltransferase involved in cell wall biosynthesis
MTIITPSAWLKNKVEQSFLKEYPIVVVHNNIDKNSFKPTESDFRKKYNLEGKIILLGVASSWNDRKGLYDFASLSEILEEKYKIVLVGITEKQKKEMPQNILCLPCTNSKKELAEIYTASDILLSLSREETFGLTIIEGLSCGAYPIVYKGTACEEVVNQNSGIAVEQNLINVKEAIMQVTSIIEKNARM